MHPLLERAAIRLDPGPAVPHGVRDVDGPTALGREWLEADGLGGFASGTALGIRTRRYHAALLVADPSPADRFLLVQGTEAWVETAAGTFALSTNLYHNLYEGDVVYPEGIAHLREFVAEPWPRWRFDLPDGTRVVAELYVPRGARAVSCTWSREFGRGPATLRVRPLLGPRDPHALHTTNAALSQLADVHERRVVWSPYAGVPSIAAASSGTYANAPVWFHGVVYVEERERGLPEREDVFSPGTFTFDLAAERAVLLLGTVDAIGDVGGQVSASTQEARWRRTEGDRRRDPRARARDAYLVRRGDAPAIVAGYPWFGEWGRDTFIAMRGLCMTPHAGAPARLDEAAALLEGWVDTVSEGMLPNRLPDRGGAPEYNSVDASLWFGVVACELVDACAASAQPLAPERRAALLEAVFQIIDGFVAGTRHRIRVDDDGLVAAGEPGVQLTWMDAKIGDWVVTPRIGKPVEVQALWLNLLALAARHRPALGELAARGRASFERRFFCEERGFLYDVVDVDHERGRNDASLRPNQIYAVGGLPHAVVDGPRARAIVDAVEGALVTPLGLRTLAAGEPGYAPLYRGDVRERDGAYHQGTVWPHLLGAFVEAWLRVHGNSPANRATARERFLGPLRAHLGVAGLGHVSEITDAEPPFTPRGAPFQAWGTGELLRLEHLLESDPRARHAGPMARHATRTT